MIWLSILPIIYTFQMGFVAIAVVSVVSVLPSQLRMPPLRATHLPAHHSLLRGGCGRDAGGRTGRACELMLRWLRTWLPYLPEAAVPA